jgi:hypothetical protein
MGKPGYSKRTKYFLGEWINENLTVMNKSNLFALGGPFSSSALHLFEMRSDGHGEFSYEISQEEGTL